MRGDGRIFRRKGKDGQDLAIWHVAYWGPVDGRIVEIRESAGTSDERKARQFLKERLREVGNHRVGAARFQGPRQERVTVKELLEALDRDYVQRGIKGLREARNHMRPVRDFFGFRRAMEVTPNLVREYIAERKKSVRVVGGKPSRRGHPTRICLLIRRSAAMAAYQCPSERQLDVLRLLVKGLTNAEIAEKLAISIETVRKHVSHALEKTGTRTRAGLVGRGLRC